MEMNKLTETREQTWARIWNILIETNYLIRQTGDFANKSQALAYSRRYGLSFKEYGVNGLDTQIIYVLSNLQYFRGETARGVKKDLNRVRKILETLA